MPSFDLLPLDRQGNPPDVISSSPEIVVAVWPFKRKSTFTYQNQRASQTNNISDAMVVDKPLFIDHILTARTMGGKKNHTKHMQIICKDPEGELITSLAPGDWMMAWYVDSADDAQTIRDRLKAGQPCNEFMSGLKFLGRVAAFTRNVDINPQNGMEMRTISLMGTGFGEFDTSIYFDPALEVSDSSQLFFFARLQAGLSYLNNLGSILAVQSIIPLLVNIFLGRGPGREAKMNVQLPVTHNAQMLVPSSIARVMNNTGIEDGATSITYSSFLRAIYGIQKYPGDIKAPWGAFIPKLSDGVPGKKKTMRKGDQQALSFVVKEYPNQAHTPSPLYGSFNPQAKQWPGVPLWAILESFLNKTMNEMFTCLRVDSNGFIQPTLIVRQIPFTTDSFVGNVAAGVKYKQEVGKKDKDAKTGFVKTSVTLKEEKTSGFKIDFTKFTELPRWKIHKALVRNYSISRSDSVRCNFVQVRSIPAIGDSELMEALQRARVPPVPDAIDIQRSGLRPRIATTNTLLSSIQQTSLGDMNVAWSMITADYMMGSHLKYSGTVTLKGIQAPICEGDNVEIDDLIFHIEQVEHQISVVPGSGHKTWTTTLLLSNGVPVNGDPVPDISEKPALHASTNIGENPQSHKA